MKAWTGSLHNPMLVIATVEKGVKYVQSYNKDIIVIVVDFGHISFSSVSVLEFEQFPLVETIEMKRDIYDNILKHCRVVGKRIWEVMGHLSKPSSHFKVIQYQI